jgi:hypothetical protein
MALNASAIRLDADQLIEGSIVFKQVCLGLQREKNYSIIPLISV